MTTAGFQQPSLSSSLPPDEEAVMPVTSFLCQWKIPKKRKDSVQPMSTASFEKHDYQKQKKKKVSLIEEFDPWPVECRGTGTSLLESFSP